MPTFTFIPSLLSELRLYWTPTDAEFSPQNGWPSGWQTPNNQISAVTQRLPYTDIPSKDGKWYYDEPFQVVAQGLKNSGYQNVSINDARNQKDVSHSLSRIPELIT